MSTGFVIAFVLIAAVAIGAAWKMIFSHHPIHSALYLVLNLCASAALYLLLGAPFIAVVQVAVYAGAIMVLFLFIIMYLNLGMARDVAETPLRRYAAMGAAALLGLLLIAGGALQWSGEVAGLSGSELKAAQQAVDSGKASVPGKPAGTVEADTALTAARATGAGWRQTTVEEIGTALFGRYTLPFEVASLLLLVAMIGALVIAQPHLRREEAVREEARE